MKKYEGGAEVKSCMELENEALQVRRDIIEMLYHAESGHPGGSLSIVDILVCLYNKIHVNPEEPENAERDRVVLSKGHAAPALYAVLAEHNFFSNNEFKRLRKLGGMLQGHPDKNKTPGVDACTGSLGLGVSAACGMALAQKMQKTPYRVYAILGDGELQEGIVWEAFTAAAHYELNNLTIIVDCNGLQIDGEVNQVMKLGNIKNRIESIGIRVEEIDGHNYTEINHVLNIEEKNRPVCILAKTVKGKGISYMENRAEWHGQKITEELYKVALKDLERKA